MNTKQLELAKLVQEDLVTIGFFMETTHGLPCENFLDEMEKLPTIGHQMDFIYSFGKDHEKLGLKLLGK